MFTVTQKKYQQNNKQTKQNKAKNKTKQKTKQNKHKSAVEGLLSATEDDNYLSLQYNIKLVIIKTCISVRGYLYRNLYHLIILATFNLHYSINP